MARFKSSAHDGTPVTKAMKASILWTRGRITRGLYPVLRVETGTKSLGRDSVILSLSCQAYEEQPDVMTSVIEEIVDKLNKG